MVDELEKEAKKFNESNYKNLVLGYIRTINKNYDGSAYLGNWRILAGDNPTEFINKVNSDTSHGLRFVEYFSQFIPYSDYNEQVHGQIDDKYKRNADDLLDLRDSLDKNVKIDLIHMIASIDGIYSKTECKNSLGFNHIERDIISWNGDLQQVCKYYQTYNVQIYNVDNMENIFKHKEYGATEKDIIADIDAMNITKTYIDKDETSISHALSAYYLLSEKSHSVRYKMFIKTVTLELVERSMSDEIKDFENEVYRQFNIAKSGSKLVDLPLASETVSPIFGIMRGDNDLVVNAFGDFPSSDIRKYVTTCFINYIENNMN